MYNKVILQGNITRDIELKYLPSGTAIVKLGLAVNHKYKKQDGTYTEEVMFVDVNMFGRTAEVANQYLKKGSQVIVDGRLKLESWTDKDGGKKSKHSVDCETMQMLGKKDEATSNSETSTRPNQNQKPTRENIPEIDVDNEDIPF